VVSILSRFGLCRQPNFQLLRQELTQIAHYINVIKPAAALQAIASGIPLPHQQFWKDHSISEFSAVYQALTASAERVIECIVEPDFEDANQAKVFGFLVQFIGNMPSNDVRLFLRFVTGSSVCMARPIHITFNSLSGYGRRPISHTCDCVLELSTFYATFDEFANEFMVFLHSDDAWRMDGV